MCPSVYFEDVWFFFVCVMMCKKTSWLCFWWGNLGPRHKKTCKPFSCFSYCDNLLWAPALYVNGPRLPKSHIQPENKRKIKMISCGGGDQKHLTTGHYWLRTANTRKKKTTLSYSWTTTSVSGKVGNALEVFVFSVPPEATTCII